VHSLEVVATDAGRGIILVKGAVPGAKGGLVLVFDAKKKPLPDGVPFPAAIRGAGAPDADAGEAPADESPAAGDADADVAAGESPGGEAEQEEAKE
jgi:large subunit ribosomal protein L3